MGNLKTPRPKEINFPEVKNKVKLNGKIVSTKSGKEYHLINNMCLLKSGNILICYTIFSPYVDETYIEIFSVPQLKSVAKYEVKYETEDEFYAPSFAIQLKNGNIITICEKLYIFNGESIAEGPQSYSEEILNDMYFREVKRDFFNKTDESFKHPAYSKKRKEYQCDFIIEPIEGSLLYTIGSNMEIFHIDIANLDPASKSLYFYRKGKGFNQRTYDLDIIHPSEYYPDYLYICGNDQFNRECKSDFLIFDLNKFCDRKIFPKTPLHTIEVSKSQNVFAICEYDKKYLLLDTINNGIYIVDMDLKQKVAVSILRLYIKELNKYEEINIKADLVNKDKNNYFNYLYRKMIKLKDGRVFIIRRGDAVADIREQVMQEYFQPTIRSEFIFCGNYIVSLHPKLGINVHQIYED